MAALRGLSACKFEARKLRDKIVDNANQILESREHLNQRIETQAIVDGLVGLSECSYKPENSSVYIQELAKLLQERMDEMTFR